MTTLEQFAVPRRLPRDLKLPPGSRLPHGLQGLLFLAARTYITPRWQKRYGDVFTVHLAPGGPAVVLCRHEDIRQVFAGPADTFHAGEGNAILGPIMGHHSVLLLDEDRHLASRKRVMAAFRGETTASWARTVEQIAGRIVDRWPVGTPISMHQQMNDISLEVILHIVFGVTEGERVERMRPLLQSLVDVRPVIFIGFMYPKLQRFGPWRAFLELKQRTDAVIYDEIADRRRQPDLADRTDVLSKLLVADPDQTDEELRDHLVTLLLAGHETTASMLAWTLHDLARRPELLARVQRAIDEDDRPYVDAVVKEALRVRPVIGNVARRLAKPVHVAGYDLAPGVVVSPSIVLVQRDEANWPDPADFRPERFLDGPPAPATWIPFGGGVRRCLGAALAETEAAAVLRVVLGRVAPEPVGRPEPARTRNITTVPARGARLRVRPRR